MIEWALFCPVCRERWVVKFDVPQPVDDFVKAISAVDICPNCEVIGLGKILEGAEAHAVIFYESRLN